MESNITEHKIMHGKKIFQVHILYKMVKGKIIQSDQMKLACWHKVYHNIMLWDVKHFTKRLSSGVSSNVLLGNFPVLFYFISATWQYLPKFPNLSVEDLNQLTFERTYYHL